MVMQKLIAKYKIWFSGSCFKLTGTTTKKMFSS